MGAQRRVVSAQLQPLQARTETTLAELLEYQAVGKWIGSRRNGQEVRRNFLPW